MDLFRKKDIGALRSMAQKSGLTRNLSAFDLVFLGIGSVIGTGIFVLTGIGAALYAGPGISLSFVLASIACAFAKEGTAINCIIQIELNNKLKYFSFIFITSYLSLIIYILKDNKKLIINSFYMKIFSI